MAESGAHVTSLAGAERPSIFDVVAQDSLMATIRPAVRHAVRVLAENHPDKWAWLWRHFEELFASLDFLVQNHYLKKYGGSFAENFYGLKRVPADGSPEPLSSQLHWKSLLYLVLYPYLKEKLDKLFEESRHRANTGQQSPGGWGRLRAAFLAVYPFIHSTIEGACLLYQLAYMLQQSRWHSPLVHLSGTELRLVMEEDEVQAAVEDWANWRQGSLGTKILFLLRRLLSMCAVAVSTGLSVGMFFLQFLDWWYASDANAPSLTALPTPDPPKGPPENGLPKVSPLVCPICMKTRTNDTALAVSGYVFCYPCIHSYVQQHGCCPVTGYPSSSSQLIKLYPPDA